MYFQSHQRKQYEKHTVNFAEQELYNGMEGS